MTATAKKVRGKGKRTIAREKALRDYSGTDPREYLASILTDPANYDEHRYMAANALMPYTYARLTSAKVDADVNAKINVVEIDKSGGRNDG